MGAHNILLKLPVNRGYPHALTDDFSADSGLWLDGNLNPAAVTIASGRGIWTPTSAEVLTNGTFATWSGDNPTGWTVSAETAGTKEVTERAADQGHADTPAGTGAANFYSASTNFSPNLSQVSILTLDEWYLAGVDVYRVSGGVTARELTSPTSLLARSLNTTGTGYVWGGMARATGWQIFGATAPINVTLNNMSLKHLDRASMMRLRRIHYPSYVEVGIRRTALTQKGVILFKDLNNYVHLFLDGGGNVVLQKRVAGTTTALGTAAATYGADKLLRLVPTVGWTAFSGNYDGVEKIAPVTVTDFTFQPGQWYAGITTVYNSGAIASDSFENFATAQVF